MFCARERVLRTKVKEIEEASRRSLLLFLPSSHPSSPTHTLKLTPSTQTSYPSQTWHQSVPLVEPTSFLPASLLTLVPNNLARTSIFLPVLLKYHLDRLIALLLVPHRQRSRSCKACAVVGTSSSISDLMVTVSLPVTSECITTSPLTVRGFSCSSFGLFGLCNPHIPRLQSSSFLHCSSKVSRHRKRLSCLLLLIHH